MSRSGFTQMSDEKLIKLINEGDKDALDYLMERYKNLAKNKARALFLLGGDCDDLLQEAMIGLYKAIRDFKIEKSDSFAAFASLCITRQLYSAIKLSNTLKNNPLNHYISLDNDTPEAQNAVDKIYFTPGPEETVISRETVAWLESKLSENLSEFEREVLGMYRVGVNYNEIAAKLGRTPKAVDNALQRIKKKLKQIMDT